MKIEKSFKFQLLPTKNQSLILEQYARTCNVIYNLALQQRNLAKNPNSVPSLTELRKMNELDREKDIQRKPMDYEEQQNQKIYWKIAYQSKTANISQNLQLSELRKAFSWLEETPYSTHQETLRLVQTAFKNFFDRVKKGQKIGDGKNPYGYPVFRKMHKASLPWKPNDVKIKQLSRKVDPEGKDYYSYIHVPKLPGLVKMIQNRPILGKVGGAIITKAHDRWWVSFPTQYEIDDPIPKESIVGIDLGINSLMAFNQHIEFKRIPAELVIHQDGGTLIKMPNSIKIIQRKIERLQEIFDTCKQGPNVEGTDQKRTPSNKWKKVQKRIAKLKRHQMNIREHLQHQISKELSEQFGVVRMEDLKVKNMSKSASGTVEDPGKKVKAKSGLNREILNSAWGNFKLKLDYKLTWTGGEIDNIDPKNTSRTCSKCGCVDQNNRNKTKFKCIRCGFECHADINAACNIAA